MTVTRVISFDPGETCGVSILRIPKKKPAQLVRCVEIPGTPKDIYEEWPRAQIAASPWEWVCVMEKWVNWKPGADGQRTSEVIGMVQMLCTVYGIPVIMQEPQFRMQIPDTRLGLGDYWTPDLKDHDDRRQATRHGLAWITVKALHMPTIQALFPR